jgi:hypothetical protein
MPKPAAKMATLPAIEGSFGALRQPQDDMQERGSLPNAVILNRVDGEGSPDGVENFAMGEG